MVARDRVCKTVNADVAVSLCLQAGCKVDNRAGLILQIPN